MAALDNVQSGYDRPLPGRAGDRASVFWSSKRMFDVTLSVLALPVFGLFTIIILCLNPAFNRGPLFFQQDRMGRGNQPFRIIKFRTMLPVGSISRGPEDPIEADRITRFGAILRRTRIDETPQLINILWGEMSLIGPRPDMLEHAEAYLESVLFYHRRFAVRPGITGLAHVACGYAEGSCGTMDKARKDAIYVRRAYWRLDARIFMRTVIVILTGYESK